MPGITPHHMWHLVGAFEVYVGAVLHISFLQYVQVQRTEYHSTADRDAPHEARKEYHELERRMEIKKEDAHAPRHEP